MLFDEHFILHLKIRWDMQPRFQQLKHPSYCPHFTQGDNHFRFMGKHWTIPQADSSHHNENQQGLKQ